jgi:holo-[acyl-carrier protein] synthase
MKAIGTGWKRGVTWLDFEVVNQPSGRPTLQLAGRAREIADSLGVRRVSVSLTHTASNSFAIVILEDEDRPDA